MPGPQVPSGRPAWAANPSPGLVLWVGVGGTTLSTSPIQQGGPWGMSQVGRGITLAPGGCFLGYLLLEAWGWG